MREARDQDANPAGEGSSRLGQPATSNPATVGWNSKHPHDIKFPFGPSAGGTGDEVERDEAHQRPANQKEREAGGEPATAGKQRHRKVVRVTVGDLSEDIDVALAPLIQATWEAGIETFPPYPCDCCGRICIAFPTHDDAAEFLNVTARFEPGKNSLYSRASRVRASDESDRHWVYELHPWDRAYDDPAENPDSTAHDGEPDFDFVYSVQLPQDDLRLVTQRMQAFAQRKLKGGLNQTIENLLVQTRRKARRGQ